MSPQLAATSPPRKRFLREARAAAAIKHENIVQVYNVEEQPLPYLVMEYVEGQTLQQKLDGSGPLELAEFLHLARQMAAGLAAAHEKGLIHRDIKPGNILLERGADQKVKITDFGLARTADDASMTRTGIISGTPMYMSPEQAQGKPLDARSDLFSLGSVLYQMACGRPPFRAPTTIAVLMRVVDDTPRSMKDVIPEVPDWLVGIVMRLLEKDPAQRFQSAKELAELLARCQSELQLTGKVTCVPAAVPERSAPPAPVAVSAPPAPVVANDVPTQRSPWLVLGWVVALVVIMATTFWFVRKGMEQSPEIVQPTPAPTGWQGWPADAPKPAIAPFDAAQAKQHQAEWAEYLKVPVEWENSIGMKFVLIPPGEFLMGSTEEEIDVVMGPNGNSEAWKANFQSETPRHRVILTKPFYAAAFEVTQQEYEKVTGENPSGFSLTGRKKEFVAGKDSSRHPVEGIWLHDAAGFCATLSSQEQLKPRYFRAGTQITPLSGNGYRLPTEAEWEFACRAGTISSFWNGDTEQEAAKIGWSSANSGAQTHPVGELKGNPFGLYDTHGNVAEWVSDTWDAKSYSAFEEAAAVDPQGMQLASELVINRGGSWHNNPSQGRSAARDAIGPTGRGKSELRGFRPVLSVEGVRLSLSRRANTTTSWHGWPADAPKPAIAPFTAEQAKEHQKKWAEYLKVPVEYENGIGMKFGLIPPGEFLMGASDKEIAEALRFANPDSQLVKNSISSAAPQHRVVLTQPFYFGTHEVTQKDYATVIQASPSHFAPTGAGKDLVANFDTARFPVEMVNWTEAVDFCKQLGIKESLESKATPRGPRTPYRLPTEAEWEFACRAGTVTNYWPGDTFAELKTAAWHAGTSDARPHAVGELAANPFGLFDVHGNVWEWVHDGWWPGEFEERRDRVIVDPITTAYISPARGMRGSDWSFRASICRSAHRGTAQTKLRNALTGFRAAITVEAVRELLKAKENPAASGAANTNPTR